jgi:glutathione S-transferase
MPARLVTIPISHYCEKARWALGRARIAYREER